MWYRVITVCYVKMQVIDKNQVFVELKNDK